MNQEKAKERLDAIEHEAKQLRKLIEGSAFDWDSISLGSLRSHQEIWKMEEWMLILQHLADHFNPDEWEWGFNSDYKYILFNHHKNCLFHESWITINTMTPKFHPDVIDDVIKELNSNKKVWWHLVTDKKL